MHRLSPFFKSKENREMVLSIRQNNINKVRPDSLQQTDARNPSPDDNILDFTELKHLRMTPQFQAMLLVYWHLTLQVRLMTTMRKKYYGKMRNGYQYFLLFRQCFLLIHRQITSSLTLLVCRLKMLSISTKRQLCRLQRDKKKDHFKIISFFFTFLF